MRLRKSHAAILAMLLASPVFGVYLANLVGYREPLDVAAEALNLTDTSDQINWTPLKDYSVPGLPDWLGYILSGALGVAVIALIGLLLSRAAKGR